MSKIEYDLDKYEEGTSLSDLPDTFSGTLDNISIESVERDATDKNPAYKKQVMQFAITITEEYTTDKELIGSKITPSINYNKRIQRTSQLALLRHLARTKLQNTNLQELIGENLLWERHPISELPNFKPSDNWSEDYPRHYPVKIL